MSDEQIVYSPAKTLIADLDGTVVQCGIYYKQAEDSVAQQVATVTGMPAEAVRELLQWLDLFAIRTCSQGGFQRDRFPKSAAAAALAAMALTSGGVDPHEVKTAYWLADQVFEAPYEPFAGAIDTLKAFRAAGWRVLIYTKGDPEVQERKITMHGLDRVVDGWKVVPRKDVQTLKAFCDANLVNIGASVYVGDSERDDILPAKELGLRAVRIATRPEDEWAYNPTTDETKADAYLASLADLPSVVPVAA